MAIKYWLSIRFLTCLTCLRCFGLSEAGQSLCAVINHSLLPQIIFFYKKIKKILKSHFHYYCYILENVYINFIKTFNLIAAATLIFGVNIIYSESAFSHGSGSYNDLYNFKCDKSGKWLHRDKKKGHKHIYIAPTRLDAKGRLKSADCQKIG